MSGTDALRAAQSVGRRILMLFVAACLGGCGQGGGGVSRVVPAAANTPATAPTGAGAAPPASAAPAPANNAPTAAPAAAAGCSVTTYLPNFASESDPASGLPNQLYHWNALPAQVYFVPSDYVTPDRKAQTLAGFDWWALATAQPGLYQETSSRANAGVIVQFEARGETGYGAITEYHFNDRRQMLDATITFNMTYLAQTASIVPVAAHEFGHALGIAGHSGDHGDVMSSSADVYTRTQLSVRDVNTMQTAYCGLASGGASGGGGGASKSATHNASQSAMRGASVTTVTMSCRFDGAGMAARP